MKKAIPIGIDLGNTNCYVAYWDSKAHCHKVIPNTEGSYTTPPYVAFSLPRGNKESELLVGGPAVCQSGRNPTNTIYDAKRLIGRDFHDYEVQQDI